MPDPGDTTGLPDCPLTDFRARRFNTGFDEEIAESTKNAQYREHYYSYLHPMSNSCFVQHQDKSAEPNVLTQQCCYDENGLLLVDPKEAHLSIGTPLYQDTASMVAYYRDTVLPFIHCCKEGVTTDQSPSQCRDYQSKLPVNTGSDGLRSEPHPQCAAQVAESSDAKRSVRSIETRDFGSSGIDIGCGCPTITTYTVTVTITISPPSHSNGDPHISTPDGLQYTFNGKGEFTYVETMDGSFVAQCRLEQATGTNGTLVAATLFTAIVAKTNTSDKVQMSLVNGNDIEVLVNDCVIDLSAIRWKQFTGVGLTRTTNGSVVASFTGGYFIEVGAEHDMLSIITMSLPDEARGQTQGLIGNYNCDPSDDLIPKGMSEPIPADSSLEDVHYNFGLTWLLNSSNESLFCYKDSENFHTFYDPDFIPVFNPSFDDPELEKQANEMCKGVPACLFDVAATGRLEIGMSALLAKEEEMTIANLSTPIVCDPQCVNGACVANDTCQCPEDFTGSICEIPVNTPCDVNVCQHGGNCSQHVFTRTCECPPGFTGSYCEEILCEPECKFGECDTTIGVCNCSCGYVGNDCSEECTPTVDLCLAVDTSRSIKNFQIQRQNQALSQLADMLNVGSQKCQTRVAAVVYGKKAEVSFSFDDHASSKSLARALVNLQRESTYKQGGTRPDLGLSECVRLLQDEGRSGKCRQHIIVSFMEGMPNPRNIDFAPVVGSIKSAGIKVVAVGTTARTSREDLLEVALDDPDYVLQSSNFFALMNIVPDIADRVKICTECVNNQ
jgi:deleted-in-malignant-brain-tumors protein 1